MKTADVFASTTTRGIHTRTTSAGAPHGGSLVDLMVKVGTGSGCPDSGGILLNLRGGYDGIRWKIMGLILQ